MCDLLLSALGSLMFRHIWKKFPAWWHSGFHFLWNHFKKEKFGATVSCQHNNTAIVYYNTERCHLIQFKLPSEAEWKLWDICLTICHILCFKHFLNWKNRDFFLIWLAGYGVFANKSFSTGEFLLEYVGDHISSKEGDKREQEYSNEGSFLFFFGNKW